MTLTMHKVALFSVPRSGSTWLGEMINSSPEVSYKFQPNIAYSFKYSLSESSNKSEIDFFFKELLETKDNFVNGELSISSKKKSYTFQKGNPTTLCFKETHYLHIIEHLLETSSIKIIGLVRSPFAVINSWLRSPKEFHQDWNINKEWENASLKNQNLDSHFFGYKKWKEACFLFLKLKKLYPKQFYLVDYDDLIKNAEDEVRKIFNFMEISYTEQTSEFISKSSSYQTEDVYAVFRKKTDDLGWQSSLPDFIELNIKKDTDFIKLNSHFKWI
jgi:hypothetical protein